MLRTHIDAYRAALFVSLGLSAAACGARAGADGAEGEGGDDQSTTEEPALPENLRCTGETTGAEPGLLQCDNGIIHRAVAEAECHDCPPAPPELPALFERCSSDAECGPGLLCVASLELTFCTAETERRYFACQTPEDECGADAQCAAPLRCRVLGAKRGCAANDGCATPGRPFLVEAVGRVAGIRAEGGWSERSLAPAPLEHATRETLARHWCEAARLEHASIAAFARFTLQLLEHGAPYALVQESQRALADETEHARLCFELASRYAGSALGPGPLSIEGALAPQSLDEMVQLVFHEGCIGETSAALQASEALALATDGDVRRVLARIAEDESRHAELAWRFVAWALERDMSGQVLQGLRTELRSLRAPIAQIERETTRGDDPPVTAAAPELADHGLLTRAHQRQAHLSALRYVVLPCAERLLQASRGSVRCEAPNVAT
jgi:hypothetical protein